MTEINRKRSNCLPKNKMIIMEFSEVLSFDNLLQNLNDSKNNLKLSSQRKSKKSFCLANSNSEYTQNSLAECKFSHLIFLNTVKLQMRKYFFEIFRRKIQVHSYKSSPVSSLSDTKKELLILDKSNDSEFSNEKIHTQCSSEIKEFRLEEFYKSQSLDNLCRVFERLFIVKAYNHQLSFLQKFKTFCLSKHLKRCKLYDLLGKAFSMRNIIMQKQIKKFFNPKFYYRKWKLLVKIRRLKEQEVLKNLFIRDKVDKKFTLFVYNNIFKSHVDARFKKASIKLKNQQKIKERFLSFKLIYTLLSIYRRKISFGILRMKKLISYKTNKEKEVLLTNIIQLRKYATDIYYNKSFSTKIKLVNLHKFLLKIVDIVCYKKKMTWSFKHWSKLLLKETFEEFVMTKNNVDTELNFVKFKCSINTIHTKLLCSYSYFFEKLTRKTLVIQHYNNNLLKCDELYNDKLKRIFNLLCQNDLRNSKLKNMCFLYKSIKRYVFQVWESNIKAIRKNLVSNPQVIKSSICYQLVQFVSRKIQASFSLLKVNISSTFSNSIQRNSTIYLTKLLKERILTNYYSFLLKLKSSVPSSKSKMENARKIHTKRFVIFLKEILKTKSYDNLSIFFIKARDYQRNHISSGYFFNKLKGTNILFNSLDLFFNRFKYQQILQIFNKYKIGKLKTKQIKLLIFTLKNQFNLFDSRNKRFFFHKLNEKHQIKLKKTLTENEELQLIIDQKKKDIQKINEDTLRFESMLKNSISKAERCGVCSVHLYENYISNSINSIKEEINNINAYRSNSLSNYILEKEFNLPNSKNIYQKTDSSYEKDFNIPMSNKIMQSQASDLLYEKDFNIPKSNEILEQSNKRLELNIENQESIPSMSDLDNESCSINKEYSMEEMAAFEYTQYLKNSYKVLSNKRDEMENTYQMRIQRIKVEVQDLVNEVEELVKLKKI